MNLLTLEEARVAFCQSALVILETVHAPEPLIRRLIAGHGSRKPLAPAQRSVVYLHWALLADLEQAGYMWAIEGEIDGIMSCIDTAGVKDALQIIGSQLPRPDTDTLGETAA